MILAMFLFQGTPTNYNLFQKRISFSCKIPSTFMINKCDILENENDRKCIKNAVLKNYGVKILNILLFLLYCYWCSMFSWITDLYYDAAMNSEFSSVQIRPIFWTCLMFSFERHTLRMTTVRLRVFGKTGIQIRYILSGLP